jgi:DNA invertase Pin-like site-specific DNA recombinase
MLRFASLVRVSTERQEQQGESLRTQPLDNERDAALLGGRVVEHYGADRHEHATEGWERSELVRLTKDAEKGKFDAVIIQNADRWDRGSKEAKHAREVFQQHGIKFFISIND